VKGKGVGNVRNRPAAGKGCTRWVSKMERLFAGGNAPTYIGGKGANPIPDPQVGWSRFRSWSLFKKAGDDGNQQRKVINLGPYGGKKDLVAWFSHKHLPG